MTAPDDLQRRLEEIAKIDPQAFYGPRTVAALAKAVLAYRACAKKYAYRENIAYLYGVDDGLLEALGGGV